MKIFAILACLACLVWLCACAVASPAAPQPTAPPAHPEMTGTVAEILKSPAAFVGQTVEIVGYFRGWDLLAEAGGGPPVTRSDWVIKDNSGAIYVTGMLPEGLDPAAREQVETVIRLTARVAQKGEAAYLEAQSVRVESRP